MSTAARAALRSWRYGGALGLCAVAFAAFALLIPWGFLPFAWLAMAWAIVGLAYVLPDPLIFGKRDGRLSRARVALLAPYLVPQHAVWRASRRLSGEPAYQSLADGVLIGRRLLLGEYPEVGTVVDCTAEFDDHVPAGAAYLPFPLLDGMAAQPESLRWIASQVCAAGRPVYIHCAQGHGRTAMVAAAVLLESKVARDTAEAIAQIRSVRPRTRLSSSQLGALKQAFECAV